MQHFISYMKYAQNFQLLFTFSYCNHGAILLSERTLNILLFGRSFYITIIIIKKICPKFRNYSEFLQWGFSCR